MILVKVKSHSYRDDLYINEIIASDDEIIERDKIMVKRILLKEVTLGVLF